MTQENFETRVFTLTVRDYAAHAIFNWYHSLLDVKIALLQVLPTVSIFMALAGDAIWRGDFVAAWPAIALYPALILTVMPLIFAAFVFHNVKRTPNLTEAGTVSITPDAFVIRRGQLTASLNWGAFKKVVETRTTIYLSRNAETHVVPKSAFASMDMARAAAALARRSVKQARRTTKRGLTEMSEATPAADELVSPPFEMTFRIFLQLIFRSIFWGPGIVLLLIPCGGVALVAWRYRADILDGDLKPILMAFAIAATLAVLYALIVLPLAWLFARRVPTTMGKRRIAIAPGYIRASGEGYTVQFPWKDLRRIVQTRRYLICYPRAHGFIVLPARAFATQAEADAFFQQARAWADAARTV